MGGGEKLLFFNKNVCPCLVENDQVVLENSCQWISSKVWWHISAITCQIIMSTCQIIMSTCRLHNDLTSRHNYIPSSYRDDKSGWSRLMNFKFFIWDRAWPFIWTNVEFEWNWFRGSGENLNIYCQQYFPLDFVVFMPLEKNLLELKLKLSPIHPRMF